MVQLRSTPSRWLAIMSLICLFMMTMSITPTMSAETDQSSTCSAEGTCLSPNQVCEAGFCVRKSLFPLSAVDVVGTVGTFIACTLASGGGLGGGGLMVPLFIIALKMNPHEAIPLSKAAIFGCAMASNLVLLRRRHPLDSSRRLIDFESMIMMEPMTLAGTVLGVILNQIFPEWLITILLVLLLSKTTLRTYRKGVATHTKEATEAEQHVISSDSSSPLLSSEQCEVTAPNEVQLSRTGSASTAFIPVWGLIELCFAWIALLLFSLVKGGHGAASIVGLHCGSKRYWILHLSALAFFAGITLHLGYKTVKRHKVLQRDSSYKYLEGDMKWNAKAAIKYPVLCTFAGIAAGLVGVGGGMVKGPLLLEMGVLPQVTAATSSFMILFTASATSAQYIVLGSLQLNYALWYGMIGFVSGIVGQLGLAYVVNKYRRTSYVIFLIAAVIGASGIVMTAVGIIDMFEHGLGEFRSVCAF